MVTIEDDKDFWARVFNRDVSAKVHAYGDNPELPQFHDRRIEAHDQGR